jgi:hypothetical protein
MLALQGTHSKAGSSPVLPEEPKKLTVGDGTILSTGEKIYVLIRAAGLVAGLVCMQQLLARYLFGIAIDWPAVPQLILVNFGLVAGWLYFRDPGRKIPLFAVTIAAVVFTVWLRAVLVYTGLFRIIAPQVTAFVEKQLAILAYVVSMPQFVPAALAAALLLLLLPKLKEAGKAFATNAFFRFSGD